MVTSGYYFLLFKVKYLKSICWYNDFLSSVFPEKKLVNICKVGFWGNYSFLSFLAKAITPKFKIKTIYVTILLNHKEI